VERPPPRHDRERGPGPGPGAAAGATDSFLKRSFPFAVPRGDLEYARRQRSLPRERPAPKGSYAHDYR
jgi:hypothetical protein